MKFNPEDGQDFGPHCRNCHRGSSSCGTCHTSGDTKYLAAGGIGSGEADSTTTTGGDANNSLKNSAFETDYTTTNQENTVTISNYYGFFKKSRTVDWNSGWRSSALSVPMGQRLSAGLVAADCADDGFSWPHRTLGWKMLKDDLFGLDFDNSTPVAAGAARTGGMVAHDLDSVCLDCHNPTIWNATSALDHTDDAGIADDNDDELILRGLP
ncbi:MAG: hypothetical protein QME41_07740 [Actinomycetota bacterium]|nr:hypothetical protein [Actinomycetota bacterium]